MARTRQAFPEDGFDRRRAKRVLALTAALISLGVTTRVLPGKAETIAAGAGFLAIVL
jgi:hypothetical protein